MTIARIATQAAGQALPLKLSVYDMRAAYRSCLSGQPQYTLVALVDRATHAVVYCPTFGLPGCRQWRYALAQRRGERAHGLSRAATRGWGGRVRAKHRGQDRA